MQKCYECGKIYFSKSRMCPKCGADQWEGKYGDNSRFSLQNMLKEMDFDESPEEYIFIGELIVKKMEEEEKYDEFGWKAVNSLIEAYTNESVFRNFKRAIDLCPIYGLCMNADFHDDPKIAENEKLEEIYSMPDCPFKPAKSFNVLEDLLSRLVKDIENMPKQDTYDFIGRDISRKDLGKAIYNLNKYAQNEMELPSAPKFMYYIGKAYEEGRPFPLNTTCAKMWYKEAEKRGFKND